MIGLPSSEVESDENLQSSNGSNWSDTVCLLLYYEFGVR